LSIWVFWVLNSETNVSFQNHQNSFRDYHYMVWQQWCDQRIKLNTNLHLGVIFIAFDSQVPESSIVTFSSWDLHSIHSKNSPVRNNSDLGPRGLDPFLGLFNPESVSMWPGFCIIVTRNLVKCGDFDSDSGTRWQGFRVKVTQKWAWPTGTKNRINSDPGVLRV